jgi:hypothetical protein
MRKILFLLIVVAVASATLFAQERYLKPVDEASQDPSFLAFRTKLIAAVDRKDAAYIYSIVDPKIKNGFGGRDGMAWFKRDWKLANRNSDFWKKFTAVIKNGGAFTGDWSNKLNSFSAPYSYSNWPEDLDSFEFFLVFGSDVNLRKEPKATAEVVAKLSYNIVKIDGEGSTTKRTGPGEFDLVSDWHKVKTLGGKEGFVKAEFVRSSIDYRAGFEKKRGRWIMTFFLAGD